MAVLAKWLETWKVLGVDEPPSAVWLETWGEPSFDLEETAGPAISGVLGLTGDIGFTLPTDEPFDVAATAPVGMAGTLALTGDVEVVVDFEVDAPPELAINGQLGVSGDIEFTTGFLDLMQVGAIGISGAMGTFGALQTTIEYVGSITQIDGVLGVSGDILAGNPVDLVVSGDIPISGQLGVSGDIGFFPTGSLAPQGPGTHAVGGGGKEIRRAIEDIFEKTPAIKVTEVDGELVTEAVPDEVDIPPDPVKIAEEKIEADRKQREEDEDEDNAIRLLLM